MPTIVSKKNENNIQAVSIDIWNKMKQNGMARRFKILNDSDIVGTVKETPLPIEVKNFMVEKIEDVIEEEAYVSLKDRAIYELKSVLKKQGVEFEHGKIKQYYIDLINEHDGN